MIAGPALIDTNVVVSGLITAVSASPTARILGGMLTGRFRFLLSLDLIAEYRDVLRRSKIRAKHGLSDIQIDVILTEIAANGVVIETDPQPRALRKGDEHLRRILASEPTAILVTGDDKLIGRLGRTARTLDPRNFANLMDEDDPRGLDQG